MVFKPSLRNFASKVTGKVVKSAFKLLLVKSVVEVGLEGLNVKAQSPETSFITFQIIIVIGSDYLNLQELKPGITTSERG